MWDKIGQVFGSSWDVHPTLLVAIGGLACIYVAGVFRGQRSGYRLSVGQGSLFAAAIVMLTLTLQSPLHHLADRVFFSAHMIQHLILVMFVPPLLLLGTPDWLIRPLLDRRWVARLGRHRMYAVVAFVILNVPFTYVHLPAIYDTLFGSELLHRITHMALLGMALITWLPMLSPLPDVLPRISQPAQMLYAFAQTLPGALVGSLLTLTDQVLYKHYGTGPEQFGVSALTDQQLGGLLMWVVGGTYWLVILTVIFFVWADREQDRAYG